MLKIHKVIFRGNTLKAGCPALLTRVLKKTTDIQPPYFSIFFLVLFCHSRPGNRFSIFTLQPFAFPLRRRVFVSTRAHTIYKLEIIKPRWSETSTAQTRACSLATSHSLALITGAVLHPLRIPPLYSFRSLFCFFYSSPNLFS